MRQQADAVVGSGARAMHFLSSPRRFSSEQGEFHATGKTSLFRKQSIWWVWCVGCLALLGGNAWAVPTTDFQVIVVEAKILPTKQDGNCWDFWATDVCEQLFQRGKDLVQHRGGQAWQRFLATKGIATMITGSKMPDPYVRLRFGNGHTFQTHVEQDTLMPQWGSTTQVAISAQETLEIEVLDKDLYQDDRIGHSLRLTIPPHVYQRGGSWKLRFEQVYSLTLMFVKTKSPTGGLFSPGLYEITIQNASVQKTKRNGKSWDAFQGLPDPYVVLKLGAHQIKTPVERNTLRPSWWTTGRVYLNGNEPFVLEVWDKDLQVDDLVGRCKYSMVAHAPFDTQGILRVQCQQIREILIRWKKIR